MPGGVAALGPLAGSTLTAGPFLVPAPPEDPALLGFEPPVWVTGLNAFRLDGPGEVLTSTTNRQRINLAT